MSFIYAVLIFVCIILIIFRVGLILPGCQNNRKETRCLLQRKNYLFDFDLNENDFFYTWTELAITPFRNFRTGISANKTKLFQSDLEFQRGIFTEYSFWKLTTGVHYFNPFLDDWYVCNPGH